MQEEEKRSKAQEKFLKDAIAAEKTNENQRKAQGSARPCSAKTTGTVRLSISAAANPKEKKVVVVKRTSNIDEVFKTAKSKLKMKKLGKSATMLDGTVGFTACKSKPWMCMHPT